MTKELAQLGTSIVEKNSILAQYMQVQHRKAIVAKKAVELRDQHQSFKEEQQRLKVMKYEDNILKMNKCILRIVLDMVHFKNKLRVDTIRVGLCLRVFASLCVSFIYEVC